MSLPPHEGNTSITINRHQNASRDCSRKVLTPMLVCVDTRDVGAILETTKDGPSGQSGCLRLGGLSSGPAIKGRLIPKGPCGADSLRGSAKVRRP